MIPNRLHARVPKQFQSGRQEREVFPTLYRLNIRKDLELAFPDHHWERVLYSITSEPTYSGRGTAAWCAMRTINKYLPNKLNVTHLIFLRRLAL